jgi:hypothetical protein
MQGDGENDRILFIILLLLRIKRSLDKDNN